MIKKNVLLDLRWLKPGETGGIEILARSLIQGINNFNDDKYVYSFLLPRKGKASTGLKSTSRTKIVIVDGVYIMIRRLIGEFLARFGSKKLVSWQKLSRLINQEVSAINPDVVVSFIGYIDPHCYQYKNLLFIPDVLHEHFPEFFSEQILQFRQKNYSESMRIADKILTISQFSKKSILKLYPELEGKVDVIYPAPDKIYFMRHTSNESTLLQVLDKYHIKSQKYLLYPANTWPHKNHRIIVEALHVLRDKHKVSVTAVFTGSAKEAHQALQKQIKDYQLNREVIFTGYVSRVELCSLYQQAMCLVFPSFYEGFGLPLVEAMWCECPIICSTAGSIPEVVGSAGLYFNEHSADDLAENILRLGQDSELKHTLIQAGREQREKFLEDEFLQHFFDSLRSLTE